jgi:hypothetical protein
MTTPTTYKELVASVVDLINIIIPMLFAILFVFFIWKIVDSWVLHAGDEAKRTEGKKYAILSVVVFVVMISAWGIVSLIRESIFGA